MSLTSARSAPKLGRVPQALPAGLRPTMGPELRRKIHDAPPLSWIDLGSGVLGVKPDPKNKAEFYARRVPLIVRSLMRGTVEGATLAARYPYRLDCSDAELTDLLDRTCFGRRIEEGHDGPVIDLRHHEALPMLPGFYSHGILAKLRRTNGRYEVDQINLAGHSIHRDHPNWTLAKIHLVAAIDNETLFADHAVVHLHNNYVEAAARRTLATHHPMWLFLRPHFDVAIPLNEWIFERFFKYFSVGNPFGHPASSILKVVEHGLRRDHTRGQSPTFVDTWYNRAIDHARVVVRDHVDAFVAQNLREDSPDFDQVRAFANALHERVPYVPSGSTITLPAIAEVLTRFIHEAAFFSATDHIVNRNEIGYFRSVFRVRKPFTPDARWESQDLFQRVDTFQRIVFRNVFSGEGCSARLDHVDYDPALRLNVAPFRRGLGALEQRYPTLFPRDQIPATIEI